MSVGHYHSIDYVIKRISETIFKPFSARDFGGHFTRGWVSEEANDPHSLFVPRQPVEIFNQ